METIFGLLIDAFLLGLIFTKLARPCKRANTNAFSRNAAISKRSSRPCLMFQIADIREQQLLDCRVRLYLNCSNSSYNTTVNHISCQSLKVGTSLRTDNLDFSPSSLFLPIPITIIHVTDEDSPLHYLTKESLKTAEFELVAVVEGVTEATGATVQAKTSYLPYEIMWDHNFNV